MAFTVELKGKPLEIKFGYGMLFKANKKLASKDKNGNSQNDGAGVLFAQVLEEDDDALVNIIKLAAKGDPSENDILTAIGEYVEKFDDEEEGYGKIFSDLKAEMLDSGFFVKKLKKYIGNLEKANEAMKGMNPTKDIENPEMQAKGIQELADRMKKELSLRTVPDKD